MIARARTRYLLRRTADRLLTPLHTWRERRLAARAAGWRRPRHIGLILDGNRRFARLAGFSQVVEGHARGAAKVRELLTWCREFQIPMITIWIFSTDNFSRPADEVKALLGLIEEKTREIANDPELRDHGLRLRFLGRLETLPASLQEAIRHAEKATADLERFQLNVAIAYGGREELLDGVRDWMAANPDRPAGDLAAELRESTIGEHLYTAGMPDPDLVIRTSGELRLSGFMIWQAAYAEYYFCHRFWPEFRRLDFLEALYDYHRRQRRFGK